MSTLPHMESNNAEALGSGAPDATVIPLITERIQPRRGPITELWAARSSPATSQVAFSMRGHLHVTQSRVADEETDTAARIETQGAAYRRRHATSTYILHRPPCMSPLRPGLDEHLKEHLVCESYSGVGVCCRWQPSKPPCAHP